MSDVKKIATRDSYGNALAELGAEHKDLVVLDADLAAATKTGVFKKAFPERHIDCGIAECNMMGVAAGLATTGKIVFASSFAMFAAGRAYEQIRNSIAYPKLNVKICATHAGITVGEDGATHQMLEDLSLMRRLPNMTSNKTKMRVLDSLPLVYWQNGDNAKKKITKMAWDKKYIVAEEMAVIVPIPENVLDDADYDIWGEVRPRIEEAMGKKFDQAVFVGVDKPTGFRADLLTSALNAGATITPGSNTLYQSINNAMTKVEESGYNVNGAVGGVDLKGKFRMMLDTTGQPIKGTEIDSLSKAYVDNGAWDKTKAQMIVGDFSQAVYAIRQDITFKVLDQAVIQDPATGDILYNLAQDDMVALRVVMRLGWEIPNPINSLQPDESVRFPFAVILPGSYSEDRVNVTINVKDQDATNLTGAKVNFNGQIKTTNASGNAVFKANKNSTGLYRVTAEDMKRDVIGSVEVAAVAKTENVVINVKKKSE